MFFQVSLSLNCVYVRFSFLELYRYAHNTALSTWSGKWSMGVSTPLSMKFRADVLLLTSHYLARTLAREGVKGVLSLSPVEKSELPIVV